MKLKAVAGLTKGASVLTDLLSKGEVMLILLLSSEEEKSGKLPKDGEMGETWSKEPLWVESVLLCPGQRCSSTKTHMQIRFHIKNNKTSRRTKKYFHIIKQVKHLERFSWNRNTTTDFFLFNFIFLSLFLSVCSSITSAVGSMLMSLRLSYLCSKRVNSLSKPWYLLLSSSSSACTVAPACDTDCCLLSKS